MRKDISEKIAIPEGVQVEIAGNIIKLKKGNNEMEIRFEDFIVKKEGNELELECKKSTKNEKKLLKTCKAHINNAFLGFDKVFVYKLQICAVHFPMTVAVDKAKNELVVKNYLGEVKPRIAKLIKGVDVKVEKEIITVESHNKEKAGQTAANIEQAVKITNRDRRTFQDGIFIIEKPK